MPVSGSKYTEYTPTSDNSSGKSSSKKKNTIDVEKIKEQFQNSDWNDDQTRYRIASQIASENLSDKENVTKEEYRDEIDNIYSQLGSTNTGASVRGGNPFFDAIGGLKDLINGAQHGIASGVDWLYDNTIGGLTGTQDMFNADDVEGVVDILGDIALTAAGPAGWAFALGKNAIQNSDALYEGITGKDAITGLDIDDGARAAGLAQGIGGTALAALPGFGKAAAKSGAKALKAASKTADDAANAAAKSTAKEAAEETAEAAPEKMGVFKSIKNIKKSGDEAAQSQNILGEYKLPNGEKLSQEDLMKHSIAVMTPARKAAEKKARKELINNTGIALPESLTGIKNVAKSVADNTIDSIKAIPASVENIPNAIQTETLPRLKARSTMIRHPFNKDAREISKEYLRANAPKDIQDAELNAQRILANKLKKAITEAEDVTEGKAKAQKVGNVLKMGAKGTVRNLFGPSAAAAFPIAYLDALDDTQSNYGSAVVPAYLGALLSRGKRANIGLRGMPGSSIPSLTRIANEAARSRRRNLDEVDLESGTYSEDQILNALKVRR